MNVILKKHLRALLVGLDDVDGEANFEEEWMFIRKVAEQITGAKIRVCFVNHTPNKPILCVPRGETYLEFVLTTNWANTKVLLRTEKWVSLLEYTDYKEAKP